MSPDGVKLKNPVIIVQLSNSQQHMIGFQTFMYITCGTWQDKLGCIV